MPDESQKNERLPSNHYIRMVAKLVWQSRIFNSRFLGFARNMLYIYANLMFQKKYFVMNFIPVNVTLFASKDF